MRDSFVEMYVINWVLEQIQKGEVRDYDWTAKIYEGQSICKHEIEYGFPPPDRISISAIRRLIALYDIAGIPHA